MTIKKQKKSKAAFDYEKFKKAEKEERARQKKVYKDVCDRLDIAEKDRVNWEDVE